MTVIELFAGCGGASRGLLLAGFESLACVEWDADAAATLAAVGFPVVQADVRTWRWQGERPDVVWANFPCQCWSTAGSRLGALDERNGWPWTVDQIDRLSPTWFIAENVPGLLQRKGASWCVEKGKRRGTVFDLEVPEHARPWAEALRGCLDAPTFAAAMSCPHCYLEQVILPQLRERFASVQHAVLNSASYGVPQTRRRLILVAGPVPIAWPEPTHAEGGTGGLLPWVSMRKALGLDVVDDEARRGCVQNDVCRTVGGRGNTMVVEGSNKGRRQGGVTRGPLVRGLEEPGMTVDQIPPHVHIIVEAVVPNSRLPQSTRTYSVDDPAPTLDAGTTSHRAPWIVDPSMTVDQIPPHVRIIGGGRNPTPDPDDRRTFRDLSDGPSTTIAAQPGGGAGNAGPFVITDEDVVIRDGEEGVMLKEHFVPIVPSFPHDPSYADRPAIAVVATESKGARHQGNATVGRSPMRASDQLWRATGRRRLRTDECAVLQDFPADWPFRGGVTSIYRQIGNAVPATLARVVGEAVVAADRAVEVAVNGSESGSESGGGSGGGSGSGGFAGGFAR